MQSKYTRIGVVQKPVGKEGDLKIDIEDDFLDDLVSSDHLFIFKNGNFIPWFIEDFRETNHLIVKLEEMDDPETAAKYTLADIYLRSDHITSLTHAKKNEQRSWVGYTLFHDTQEIGIIQEIHTYPQQIMASVLFNGKIILIPLAESMIEKVDTKARKLFMILPDGILQL